MNSTLLKVFVAIVPACVLFLASAIMLVRQKRLWSILQMLGAAGVVTVVLAHLFEALQVFPWMQWGQQRSVGHYLDLSSTIVGITLFPVGHLLHAWAMKNGQ